MAFKLQYEKTTKYLKRLFIEYEMEKKNMAKQVQLSREKNDCCEKLSYDEQQTETFATFEIKSSENVLNDILDEEQILLVIEAQNNGIDDALEFELDEAEITMNETKSETNSYINYDNDDLVTSQQIIYNHICPICMIQVPNALELRRHAKTHEILKKYLKGQTIPDNARFVAKPRESVPIFKRAEKLNQCIFCSQKIPLDSFQKHIIAHHRQSEISCDRCGRVFRKLNDLKNHMNCSHLRDFPYQCSGCDKGFILKQNYKCHILNHTRPDNLLYKCDKCDKSFANKKCLLCHSLKHTDEGSYRIRHKINKCRICLRTFESEQDLQQHSLGCHENFSIFKKKRKFKPKILLNTEGYYSCRICSETSDNITTIRKHIHNVHGSKFLCSKCGLTVRNLAQHMMTHQIKKTKQKRYRVIHSHEKPYQ